ncbi:MAG: hypothetical protein C0410_15620 [Anaerolinea sp.]|nr:hypothetical protein [Anaerolinea sp.]
MGIIIPALARIYQNRLLNPVIVEFPDATSYAKRIQDLANLTDVGSLNLFGGPAGAREVQLPRDRLLARFQNPLLAFKLISGFNMAALPLDRFGIEEAAQWTGTKIYPDQIQNILQFNVMPPEGVFKTRGGLNFTTTVWTKKMLGLDVANRAGWSGEGITVTVPDTGGRTTHQQTRNMEYHSVMKDKGQFIDKNGHGEWCCSAVGGSKVVEPTYNVEMEGMAPSCKLIGIKCLGFIIGIGFQSDIIQAIEMSMNRKADIVSMSLGSEGVPDSPEEDAECVAIKKARNQGLTFCVAAGNSGPADKTINTPGCSPDVLTVGAWDELAGNMAEFSSRGPVVWADQSTLIKPDVVAPGVNIYSGCVGILDIQGDRMINKYAILSGTSMATPQVAGLLACVKQYYKKNYNRTLTLDLVKTICEAKGQVKDNYQGWGLIHFEWFRQYALENWA